MSLAAPRLHSGFARKRKARWHLTNGLFVLATSYSRTAYRRTTIGGCSVSLPCSEWISNSAASVKLTIVQILGVNGARLKSLSCGNDGSVPIGNAVLLFQFDRFE